MITQIEYIASGKSPLSNNQTQSLVALIHLLRKLEIVGVRYHRFSTGMKLIMSHTSQIIDPSWIILSQDRNDLHLLEVVSLR